jgi:hypothetical protein
MPSRIGLEAAPMPSVSPEARIRSIMETLKLNIVHISESESSCSGAKCLPSETGDRAVPYVENLSLKQNWTPQSTTVD